MNKGVVFLGLITGLAVAVFAYALLQTGESMSEAPDRSQPLPEDVVGYSESLNPLTPIQSVPEYTLTNHKGELFKMSSMSGKVWAVDFFFTSCPGQCSTMTTNMAYLADRFKDDPRFETMSISVDPANDTAEKLAAYANRFKVSTERWHFLRTDEDNLKEIATKGLRIGTSDDPNLHKSHFVLVDKDMWIRGFYEGTDTNRIAAMERDIETMLAAEPEG